MKRRELTFEIIIPIKHRVKWQIVTSLCSINYVYHISIYLLYPA